MLMDVMEQTERVRKVQGRTLIYQGITKDKAGNQIRPAILYSFSETVQVRVNHRRRLLEVINKAKSMDGMNEDLARYLAKFAMSRDTITQSINSQLNTRKNADDQQDQAD